MTSGLPWSRVACAMASMFVATVAWAGPPAAAAPAPDGAPPVRKFQTESRPITGDFDGMFERRIIRAMIPFSRSLYFNDKGRQSGIGAEAIRSFEKWINAKYEKQLGNRPLTVVVVPVRRDLLLTQLSQGLGDIALGNVTVTAERQKQVDFVTPPDLKTVKKVVVTGPSAPPVPSLEALSGRTVHLRPGSSVEESLGTLNERLKKEGKAPVQLVHVPGALEDEDLLEMTNAGILEAIVVDDWMAAMWKAVLPKITVNGQAVLRDGDRIGWAIRKDSPKLEAEILAYMKVEATNKVVQERLRKYARRVKQLQNPTRSEEWKRFQATVALFEKYGKQYHFDPLLVAAQGYQESQLNQEARSPVGAIGVMQVMPATGSELRVGDISKVEPNIHAGTKYMDWLVSKQLSDAQFDELNRTLFAFAAYNCGPGNIQKMREGARKQGLDPNVWFDNVELVTAQKIGSETTTYVRNIFKYYVAYRLMQQKKDEAGRAREQVAPAAKP